MFLCRKMLIVISGLMMMATMTAVLIVIPLATMIDVVVMIFCDDGVDGDVMGG